MAKTVTITHLGQFGDGVAEDVFIPYAALGDVIEVDEGGKIIRILTPSPDRTAPPCRHFGICGGCALQHINKTAYRTFKKDSVLSTLEKAGIEIPARVETIFIPHGTRRRANFAARIMRGRAVIGFHERKSASIRDVPDCLLITPDVRAVMEGMRPYLPAIAGEGAKMDILIQCIDGQGEIGLTGTIAPGWEAQQALSEAMHALSLSRTSLRARDYEPYEVILEARPVTKRFGDMVIPLAPCAILQPSAEGEAALINAVTNGVGDAARIADLFCGNGTFTGPLRSRICAAYDSAGDAIAALQKAGVPASLRDLFRNPVRAGELNGADCVIIDPPRAGAKAQCAELAQSAVRRIVYVSCNPQSFAADAKTLTESGFALQTLTIVDQFIWSAHTEVVGVFTR
jgi:23S rRNA (uracil1939-C5)-methyltransferase